MKLYITYQSKSCPGHEVIDINPHAPYGSKAARKAAKERAAERCIAIAFLIFNHVLYYMHFSFTIHKCSIEYHLFAAYFRMREKELEKQKAAAAQANFFSCE